jgi:hypothetical protein
MWRRLIIFLCNRLCHVTVLAEWTVSQSVYLSVCLSVCLWLLNSCTLLLVPEVPSGRKMLAVARSALFVPEDGGSWFLQNINNSQITQRNTAAFKFVLPETSAVMPFITVSSVSVVTMPRSGHSGVSFPAGTRIFFSSQTHMYRLRGRCSLLRGGIWLVLC